ncbi:MAG TPA: hypothetical protein VLL48_12810, partial [Longimicrobiales bacterium]|nr:hypothetical protein [Longimicrobiales bacterium]
MERYPELQTVGRTFLDVASGIAVFVRPATLRGERYVKELSDRAVITWTLTEPTGGIQAFSWTPTVNRMQAVLHRSGVIELSYDEVSVGDGVVGVFPTVDAGVRTTLGAVPDAEDAGVEANLDLRSVTLSAVDDLFLEATLETRGPVLPEGDPGLEGVTYRIALEPGANPRADVEDASVVWTVRGVTRGWGGAGPRYLVSGSGAEPTVTVEGTALTVRGILPRELAGARQLSVSADAAAGEPSSVVDRVDPRPVTLDGLRSPEIDLSASKGGDRALPVAYEGFHWNGIPRAQDVACSVITALGDHFDFLASYSDFRVDNPEGGTPSTGPRGGNVSGIGSETSDLEAFCSDGRLQFMYFLPVSTSAVQFDERSPDGRMTDYDYAMSQIGHELGHRWAANADALVDGERISLGQTHWAAGVHLPSAFPYSRPYEADAMGGSTWQENPDGTFTQLDRDYYSPAKGFSWFALYLMGLARPDEVEPFFILRNLERTGEEDAEGRPIYTGDKTVITIDDVVAAMGPREPDVENAQKEFNTGVV